MLYSVVFCRTVLSCLQYDQYVYRLCQYMFSFGVRRNASSLGSSYSWVLKKFLELSTSETQKWALLPTDVFHRIFELLTFSAAAGS